MKGSDLIAEMVASGRIRGIGFGSPVADVESAFPLDCVDDEDDEGLSLRRDYGLVEFFFNGGPEWVVVGASVEVHRLATDPALQEEWRRIQGVDFPEYLTWEDVERSLSRLPVAPGLRVSRDQTGYVEYRSIDTRVSVLVVDGPEERHHRPGGGDVFSVALG
ncbi:hypothetical protein ABIA32_001300 [Streptacidiphilus sp. MAP12-20]|uniref:hypothetical protein n=1 Tax=Streptacidiphilus sp. MAP12-20 TaxID=3156299 RepID=UPI0035115ECF